MVPEAARSPPPARAAAGAAKDVDAPVAPPRQPARIGGAIRTSWYWSTLAVSLVSLFIIWIYYSTRLYFWLQIIYWVAAGLAIGLALWSFFGVLNRYNVLTRIGASAERMRDRRDAAPEGEEAVVYRENVVVRLFRWIGRLVTLALLLVWNIFLRLLYIVEITLLQALILGYDIIYYVSYAAWTVAFYAIRIALRIVRWALRVAWKILRILTYLPIAKGIWRKKMRPSIMGKWNARMQGRKERAAKRLEQRRRLVAAKGMDPDKWQADRAARHHFFLPHPHDARSGLRGRIEDRQKQDYNRRDRWTAYRKGLPLPPKYHSPRKKAKLEEKKRRKAEEKAKKRGGRDEKRPTRAPRARGASLAVADAKPVPEDE